MEHGASREMSHKFRCTQVGAAVGFSSFFECRPNTALGLKLAVQGRFLELLPWNIISIIHHTHMHPTSKRNYHYRLYTTQLTWSACSLRPGTFEVGESIKRKQRRKEGRKEGREEGR